MGQKRCSRGSRLMVAVVGCVLGLAVMAPTQVSAQPGAPAITVTPSTDLVDGQTVAVTGSGFSADWPAVAIDQCSITPFVCGVEVLLFEAGESFSTTLTLERFVEGVDCSLTPGNCAIVAANYDPVGGALGEVVTVPLTFATVPGAPTIIRNATAGDGEATVSWTPPVTDGGSAITGYVVTPYVGYSPRPSTTFNSTATTQVVTGLTNGTEYRFRVKAINAVGTGGYSTVTNPVTPKARTVPGAPTIIRNATAGDGEATVSWTPPVTDGGSAITGYVVTPYVGYGTRPSTTFNSTATTQVVTGLTNGTEYRFRVQAINAVGTGGYSTVTNPVIPKARHTLYINMESIGSAGGGSLLSLDPAIPAAACSVSAGSIARCQYSVEEGDELVLQAVPDDPGNAIDWGGGCDSVFGNSDDQCLIVVREENLSVDVFFLVP